MSLEGTAAGLAAAVLFSALALALGQVTPGQAVVAAGAAIAANFAESYIGATIQGRAPWLTNDAINVAQICFAATLAMAWPSGLPG